MIAGRMVFEKDRVQTLDEPALASLARASAARIDAATADSRLLAEAASVVVRGFCRGQCRPYSDT